MKKLKEGTFPNKEIAEWFGLSAGSFYNIKQEKLKELSNYCDFELTKKGKIKIINVLNPYYKKKRSKAYEYYLEEVPKVWQFNEVETCKRVADKIFKREIGIKENTGYYYTKKVRDELWGKPSESPLAPCRYVRSKMYKEPELHYSPLTDQELERYLFVQKNWLKVSPAKLDKFLHQLDEQELTLEDVQDSIVPIKHFKTFISMMSAEFGCDWIVLGTYIEQ